MEKEKKYCKDTENLFIVPFTTENEYRANVERILTTLKSYTEQDEILLTEGEYSYIYKKHDAYEYSMQFEMEHRYHGDIQFNIKAPCYKNIKFIVCIGTWSSGIISNCFRLEHPEITVIHIQGEILPKQYAMDRFEDLERFNINFDNLLDILVSQFQN